MTSVDTFEAKTHLTHLLERVAKGERITITNRDKPVAMLVPLEAGNERDTARIGREMLAYRDRVKRASAVRRFGTSLTRGTVTERFALEPVSLVRGVAMTHSTPARPVRPRWVRHPGLALPRRAGSVRRRYRLGGSSPGHATAIGAED